MRTWTAQQWDLFIEDIVSFIARKQAVAWVFGFCVGITIGFGVGIWIGH